MYYKKTLIALTITLGLLLTATAKAGSLIIGEPSNADLMREIRDLKSEIEDLKSNNGDNFVALPSPKWPTWTKEEIIETCTRAELKAKIGEEAWARHYYRVDFNDETSYYKKQYNSESKKWRDMIDNHLGGFDKWYSKIAKTTISFSIKRDKKAKEYTPDFWARYTTAVDEGNQIDFWWIRTNGVSNSSIMKTAVAYYDGYCLGQAPLTGQLETRHKNTAKVWAEYKAKQ